MPGGVLMPSLFFASEGTSVPIAAEPLFSIGGLIITNSMLFGGLVALLVIAIFVFTARRMTVKPSSRFAFFMESVIEFVMYALRGAFNDDMQKVRKFAGLFIAFFVFILLNNLFGLFPGMGGALYVQDEGGVKEAIFRSFTSDANGTFALATITMVTVQFYAIRARGGLGYIKHFFSVMKPWYNPANLFFGPIEILTEFTRLLTLALRLFGVIYAGEVLVHIIAGMSGNFAWIGTVPILMLEIFFSILQAYLFIMLSSVYIQIGTATHDEAHESDHDPSHNSPKMATGEAK